MLSTYCVMGREEMARKTKEEAEKTRQQILDAALDVFYDQGFSGSTLVDIAQQIGLTKGAIYWHFKSKVTLFLGLGVEMEEKMNTEIGDAFQEPSGLDEVIKSSVKVMSLIAKDRQFNKYYGLVYYRIEWQEELLPVMEFFMRQDAAFKEYLVRSMQKSQESGEISADIDAHSLAVNWIALFDGFLSRILMQKEDVDSILKDYKLGLEVFVKGIQ